MASAPELRTFPGMLFSGMKAEMSFAHNTTFELWQAFMPRRKDIPNMIGHDLYSIEVYPVGFFKSFDPESLFEKWAAVPVSAGHSIEEMEALEIPKGSYAVFIHYGLASKGAETYRHIFEEWLPGSGFTLDHRPHFAVMGEKYKAESLSSEEEIWIPVKNI